MCEIHSNLTIKTPERVGWAFEVFITLLEALDKMQNSVNYILF